MPVTLKNAAMVSLDPIHVIEGALRMEGGRIVAVGPDVVAQRGDETFDCGGAVVMPGLVNGHTHLYSALAAGMPQPSRTPSNFHEILELIWWRLDRAHDAESIEMSGRIGAIDALRCGTTTLIDHNASPDAIDGSLDRLEAGLADVGLRAVLSYEITDRNGLDGAEAGLAENRRYLAKCRERGGGRYAGQVGGHAAFTMSDATLAACAGLAEAFGVGVHIHAAEDPCDDAICRAEYGDPLLSRLEASGVLTKRSILGHGTHIPLSDVFRISNAVGAVAHNPRSNMHNGVGYRQTTEMVNLMLGTDGIGSDMFTEARCAWLKARDAVWHARSERSGDRFPMTPNRVLDMLAHSARVAGAALGVSLGRLAPGAAADVVITNYVPASPIQVDNLAGHFLFAMGPQHVRHVLVDGEWRLRDGNVTGMDEALVRSTSRRMASDLWRRMERI